MPQDSEDEAATCRRADAGAERVRAQTLLAGAEREMTARQKRAREAVVIDLERFAREEVDLSRASLPMTGQLPSS